MSYILNSEAYQLFIQIEVGIREFFVQIIKKEGVSDWMNNFLGQLQRDSLIDIIKRLNDAEKQNSIPKVEDLYLFKINRALKSLDISFKTNQLFHPFYYLNWTDLENIIKLKSNSKLFDKIIGKQNRKVLTDTLNLLSPLRNDIAHSRFISDNDFVIIRASFDQISVLIPDFKTLCQSQTKEEKFDYILDRLREILNSIETEKLLNTSYIEEISDFLKTCKDSFWLNSIRRDILPYINKLIDFMNEYEIYRRSPGGLLQIHKLKTRNLELINSIKAAI